MLLQRISRPDCGIIPAKVLAFFLACIALGFRISQNSSTVSAFQVINGSNCFTPPESLPGLAISPQVSMPWSVAYRFHMYGVMKTCDQMFGVLNENLKDKFVYNPGLHSIRPNRRLFYPIKGPTNYLYEPMQSANDSSPYGEVIPGAKNVVVVIQATQNLFKNSIDEVIQSLLYTVFASGGVEKGDHIILAVGPTRYWTTVEDSKYDEIIDDPSLYNVRYFVHSARDLCYLMGQMHDSLHDYLEQFTGEGGLFDTKDQYPHVTFDRLLQTVSLDLLHDILLFHSDNIENAAEHVTETLNKWIGPKDKFDFGNVHFSELTKMLGIPPFMLSYAYKTHRMIGLSLATRGTLLIGFVDSYTSSKALLHPNYESVNTGYCSDMLITKEVKNVVSKNYRNRYSKTFDLKDFTSMTEKFKWASPEDYMYTFTRTHFCNSTEHSLKFTALNLIMTGIEKFIFFDYLGTTNTEYADYDKIDVEDEVHDSIAQAVRYYTNFIGCPTFVDVGTKSFSDALYAYMCNDSSGNPVQVCGSITSILNDMFSTIGIAAENGRVINFYTSGDLMDPRIVPHYYLKKIRAFLLDTKLSELPHKTISCNNPEDVEDDKISAVKLSKSFGPGFKTVDPVQRAKDLHILIPSDLFENDRYYWHLGYNYENAFENFEKNVKVSSLKIMSNRYIEIAMLGRNQNIDFAYSLVYGWQSLVKKLLTL